MEIVITKGDLLGGQVVPKGWYAATCTKFLKETASAGDSINFIPTFVLKDTPFDGKVMKMYFNTKAPGNLVTLLKATNVEIVPGVKFDDEITRGKMEGFDFWVNVIEDTYNGKLNNKIVDILPIDQNPFNGGLS